MSSWSRSMVAALIVVATPFASVMAQETVGYVCAFGYNVHDKIAWVGRQIVRVRAREELRYVPADLGSFVSADFRTRMRAAYSRDDMKVTDRFFIDGGFG